MHKFIIPLFALAFLLVSCKTQTTENTAPISEESSSETGVTVSSASMEEKKDLIGMDGRMLKGEHTVIFRTSKGDITVKLDADAAPKTVTNFVALAETGYFNGLTFHRVMPDFMIQGGDPNGNGTGGESVYGESFEDEINAKSYGLHKKMLRDAAAGQELPDNLKDKTLMEYYKTQGYVYNDTLDSLPMKRGALAMANRGPNTNGSQFFIIQAAKTPWLEGKHTVFGRVTKGLEVVDAIVGVERDASDKPLEPITYNVEVLK